MQPPPPPQPRPSSRSPSPPPQAPLPQTPGTLAQRAREIYFKALSTTIQTCSYSTFAACFPTPAAKNPDVLRSAWSQFVGKLEERGKREWEEIERERGVVEGFNALEGVFGEGRVRMRKSKSQQPPPIPPHLLPPSTLYAAHLSTPLTPIAAHLSSQLVAAQSENEQLYEEILAQRREIEELVGMVEGKMADLRSAGGVMGEAIKEGDLRTLLAKVNGEAVGR